MLRIRPDAVALAGRRRQRIELTRGEAQDGEREGEARVPWNRIVVIGGCQAPSGSPVITYLEPDQPEQQHGHKPVQPTAGSP